jgi:hypothetical protein
MKTTPSLRLIRPFGFLAAGFAAASMFLLSGCVMPDGANLGYDPITRHHYPGDHPDAYRKGYQYGRSDARQGRSRNFMRYHGEYDSATKDQFGQGYLVAYRHYSHGQHGGWNGNNGNHNGPANYTASLGQGRVRILQNGRPVSVIRTELPNVERYRFENGKREIVVKSRANHGPAVVELFDTKTGARRGKVMASMIKNGRPGWARGMQE